MSYKLDFEIAVDIFSHIYVFNLINTKISYLWVNKKRSFHLLINVMKNVRKWNFVKFYVLDRISEGLELSFPLL